VWDRVFEPVGPPERPLGFAGAEWKYFDPLTQTLRPLGPPDRVGDPVPHKPVSHNLYTP